MFASAGTRGGRRRLATGVGAWDGVSVLQLGSVDSDNPISMTLQVPSVLAGTPNTLGPDFIINGARGTGSVNGGSIVFQTCPNGPAGSTRNGLFERVRISPLGALLVNQSVEVNPEATPVHFSVSANGAAVWGIDCISIGNNASPAGIIQAKTRGTTASSNVAVVAGDSIGGDYYDGNDGTQYVRAATMLCIVDGTVSAGVVPGRFEFHTNSATGANVERMRIDSAGRILIGSSAAQSVDATPATIPAVQILGTDGNTGQAFVSRFSNSFTGARWSIGHSRGTVVSSMVALNANDLIGEVWFEGCDGTQFVTAAAIEGHCDSTPSAGFVSGMLAFLTAASTTARIERMRINSSGNVGIANTNPLSLLDLGGPIATTLTYSSAAAITLSASNSSIILTSTQTVSFTLGQASSYPGRWLTVKNVGGQTVNSTGNVTPIGSTTPGTIVVASATGKFAILQSDGTNWITMVSN